MCLTCVGVDCCPRATTTLDTCTSANSSTTTRRQSCREINSISRLASFQSTIHTTNLSRASILGLSLMFVFFSRFLVLCGNIILYIFFSLCGYRLSLQYFVLVDIAKWEPLGHLGRTFCFRRVVLIVSCLVIYRVCMCAVPVSEWIKLTNE